VLLNSLYFRVRPPLRAAKLGGATLGTWIQTTKYSHVNFRKDHHGTVIAFENCGCEAEVNTFRPCRMHQEDTHQAARLIAEARYHGIQAGKKSRIRYPQ